MKQAFTGRQIQSTWDRVMECDDREFARLARMSGPFQDELSGFVVGATLDLPPEVGEYAREMMVALYEIYREHTVCVRAASEEEVIAQWRDSSARIAETEALVAAGHDVATLLVGHPQPVLLTLILGILMDVDPDHEDGLWTGPDEDRLDLEESDFWHLLTVMHTVVAVLHSHATYRSARS